MDAYPPEAAALDNARIHGAKNEKDEKRKKEDKSPLIDHLKEGTTPQEQRRKEKEDVGPLLDKLGSEETSKDSGSTRDTISPDLAEGMIVVGTDGFGSVIVSDGSYEGDRLTSEDGSAMQFHLEETLVTTLEDTPEDPDALDEKKAVLDSADTRGTVGPQGPPGECTCTPPGWTAYTPIWNQSDGSAVPVNSNMGQAGPPGIRTGAYSVNGSWCYVQINVDTGGSEPDWGNGHISLTWGAVFREEAFAWHTFTLPFRATGSLGFYPFFIGHANVYVRTIGNDPGQGIVFPDAESTWVNYPGTAVLHAGDTVCHLHMSGPLFGIHHLSDYTPWRGTLPSGVSIWINLLYMIDVGAPPAASGRTGAPGRDRLT